MLVTTGRLTGGATAEAQQYEQTLGQRTAGANRSSSFEVWDKEDLRAGLQLTPALSLNSWDQDPLRDLLGLLADAERRVLSVQAIERATRAWPGEDLFRTCVASSVVANTLLGNNRPDLAIAMIMALIRTALLPPGQADTPEAQTVLEAARALFHEAAARIVEDIEPFASDPRSLFNAGKELPGAVTYPIRCSIAIETLGMQGLLAAETGDDAESTRCATLLSEFVDAQPGAAHPISDRWAASLIPASALLRRHQSTSLTPWLEQVVVWICDRHERLPGLASVHADAAEEVERLLGDPYEHIDIDRRTQSFLATVVLDLASCLEMPGLYDDAFNDFAAVDLAFPVIEPLDQPGMLLHDETGLVSEPNIAFDEPDVPPAEGWRRAVHHRRAPASYRFDQMGRSWELLAASLLLRDRHFISSTRMLAGIGTA